MQIHGFYILIGIVFVTFYPVKIKGAACGTQTIGQDPATNSDNVDTTTGSSYVTPYAFGCCGIVDKWNVYVRAQGTIKLQVWELVSTGNYKLKGEDEFRFDAADQINKVQGSLPSSGLTITETDYIGWYTSGTDMVAYKGSTSTNGNYRKSTGTTGIGSSVNFGSGSTLNGRTYGITASTSDNSAPYFLTDAAFALPQTVRYQDTSKPFIFFTASATDDNPNDVSSLTYSISSQSVTDMFIMDGQNRIRHTSTSIPYDVGSYDVTIQVLDQCQSSVTGVLTIVVENTLPVINNAPYTGTVEERATSATSIVTLSVTDLQAYTCIKNSTTPTSHVNAFTVTDPVGVASNAPSRYEVSYVGTPRLDPGVSYLVYVSCTDAYGGQAHSHVTVNVIPNNPPQFNANSASRTISAATVQNGAVVYTSTSTDADGDQMFYNFTCIPQATCPFAFGNDGVVRVNENLNAHKVANYDLTLSVHDDISVGDPLNLQITITDINDPPVIQNLPTSEYPVNENTAVGTAIYTVSVTDANSDTTQISAVFIPGEGANYFKVEPNSKLIKVKSDIDYESLTRETFPVFITAYDGRENSTTERLILKIQDVNEQQTQFEYTQYSISGGETGPLTVPSFSVTDPDDTTTPVVKSDTQTYSIDCGAAHPTTFLIDSSTGVVTINPALGQYDLDVPQLATTTVDCVVTANDGEFDITTNLEIIINEINDNPPILNAEQYDYLVSRTATPGTTLGSPTATDEDFLATHDERQHEYSLTGSSEFAVRDNGQIYVAGDMSKYNVGDTFDLILTVTDRGDLGANYFQDSAPVQITVIDPPTTTTTTTTTAAVVISIDNVAPGSGTAGNFFDSPENLAWFIPCMILLGIMLALLAYMIWRICRNPGAFSRICNKMCNCDDCCKSRPKPRKVNVSEANNNVRNPARNDGKYEWNIWTDRDFGDKTIEYR